MWSDEIKTGCFWPTGGKAESTSSPYYETLRTTGVILAVVMFVSGILIALSKFRLSPPPQCQ
uniref:FXYD domain-containing ion transport regulator n=1 Tax=Fundulus heteroclitus TaxID=8078 RepID=A0A3Q2PH51_FUNHE